MRKYLVPLLLSCTITAVASAPKDQWLELRSPHFVVLTDTNEKQARRIASQFEQMRSVFHTLIPNAGADAGAPITVLALKDRKGFTALEPEAYLAKGQLDLAGLFMQVPNKNYILLRLDAEGEHPFATVYHEYTHFMTRRATWMPLWLNEGLAEFYQNTDIHEKEVLLGQPSPDDLIFLRQNRLLPLTTLFAVDYTSPYYHDEQKGSVFYAESWALTHFIEVNDYEKNTTRLRDYCVLLSQNVDPVLAAQQVFGDLKQLQKSLEFYIQQGSYKMFRMNTAVTVDETSFQLRPISKPEADTVRAEVLLGNQRTKEAEALLENVLRDDPKSALAHETMGDLKVQEGDSGTARKWYGEAVQLDSHSYMAHYNFAVMSLQIGDTGQNAEIESSLQTAIKLNPAFAPAYDALAMFYATHNEKLGEAHMLNLHALQLEPENLNFRINTAQVLVQQEQIPSAISVLKIASSVAKIPQTVAFLKTRIDTLQQYQASIQSTQNHSDTASEVSTMQTNAPSGAPNSSIIFKRKDGKLIGTAETARDYPVGDSTGAHHTVQGTLQSVQCSYPAVISLTINHAGKPIVLYNNNFYKIEFTTANYVPKGDIKPCTDIEGMKASVNYADVTTTNAAGQILSIELSQ